MKEYCRSGGGRIRNLLIPVERASNWATDVYVVKIPQNIKSVPMISNWSTCKNISFTGSCTETQIHHLSSVRVIDIFTTWYRYIDDGRFFCCCCFFFLLYIVTSTSRKWAPKKMSHFDNITVPWWKSILIMLQCWMFIRCVNCAKYLMLPL